MADACMRGFPGVMPHVCGNSDPLTAPRWRLKFVFLILFLSEPERRPQAELPLPVTHSAEPRGGRGFAASDATSLGESDWPRASPGRPRRSRREKKRKVGKKKPQQVFKTPVESALTSDVVGRSAASRSGRCRSKKTGESPERIKAQAGGGCGGGKPGGRS